MAAIFITIGVLATPKGGSEALYSAAPTYTHELVGGGHGRGFRPDGEAVGRGGTQAWGADLPSLHLAPLRPWWPMPAFGGSAFTTAGTSGARRPPKR
jgi:hypothetical protein